MSWANRSTPFSRRSLGDELARRAAVLVRLRQRDWGTADAESLARAALALGGSEERYVDRVPGTFPPRPRDTAAAVRFLVALRRGLPPADWRNHARAVAILDGFLRRRRSSLGRADARAELGLPALWSEAKPRSAGM